MAQSSIPTVIMYADGACKGNPGPGGWGVWMKSGEHEKSLCGGENPTTNNRMELLAVINGLESLKKLCNVELYVDSQYVKNGVEQWLANWKKNGWRTAAKKPVKNDDLWKLLDQACARHVVRWHWVKGHSGDPGNERADALANEGVEKGLGVRKEQSCDM